MEQNKFPQINHNTNEQAPVFSEKQTGDSIRFSCSIGDKEIGSATLEKVGANSYSLGGFFVDPTQRGQSLSSGILKQINNFLDKNQAIGKLVNTIQGDAAVLYEKNGWKRGEYKSQGAHGAYEYIYDRSKQSDISNSSEKSSEFNYEIKNSGDYVTIIGSDTESLLEKVWEIYSGLMEFDMTSNPGWLAREKKSMLQYIEQGQQLRPNGFGISVNKDKILVINQNGMGNQANRDLMKKVIGY